MLTKKQQEVGKVGKQGEKIVTNWLRARGYKIVDEHAGKASNKPYDIKAYKGREKWIIEVKNGNAPPVKIENFVKMLGEKGFNKIGLALVHGKDVFLLEYNKMSWAGIKASRKFNHREAAKKAWEYHRKELELGAKRRSKVNNKFRPLKV